MNRTFYVDRPKDFSPKVEVVSIFCHVDNKILMLKRNPNKPFGNTWCLPGGKLDKGEDVCEGLIREFAEETTIELDKNNVDWINTFYVRAP
ncbi:NUDIX hydrolase [Candidatus Dependentiae bacterium]